jgi:hypothetical protein
MVEGRNATPLRELMQLLLVKRAGLPSSLRLCADSKELRDRIVAMRHQVTRATDGGEDKEEQAKAKFELATDLQQQGAYEEAFALYQEAIELFTEVRFQCALSMCASGCIALHRDLIFAGCAFSSRCLHFVFTTDGRPRRLAGGWALHQPPWSFGFVSQKRGTRENRAPPCVKVPGSLRVPAPPWVGSRSPAGWDQIPRWSGGWVLH